MAKVTVSGGTLFGVAAEYLGDAAQWDRIATLNQINDPWLGGLTELQLPAALPMAGGGVASQ